MDALVGYTGFVGSNLAACHGFGGLYNSSNIGDAFGMKPDLLVYAGLRAEKFISNKFPEKDLESVREAVRNIKEIGARKLVLISTVDVYPEPRLVDEDSFIDEGKLEPYGANRYMLEKMARPLAERVLVVRLPALYGMNLKKNFIFDMMNRVPMLLGESRLAELERASEGIRRFYEPGADGFARRKPTDAEGLKLLRTLMENARFSSLSFTDSRARFQFYPLRLLWGHVKAALTEGIEVLNLATEPVSAAELYRHVFGEDFTNTGSAKVPDYDFRSKHAGLYGGSRGYHILKGFLMDDIKAFVEEGGRQ